MTWSANDHFRWLPIVPEGYCELCHKKAEVLSRVTIEPKGKVTCPPGSQPRVATRLARAVMACGRHAGGNGGPVVTPNTVMAAGTSRLRPQAERLFDSIPYRKAGEAERRWTS